jgi:hypothetical protein
VHRLHVEHLVKGLLGKEVRAVLQHPILVVDALASQSWLPKRIGRRRGWIWRSRGIRLSCQVRRAYLIRRGHQIWWHRGHDVRVWLGRDALHLGEAVAEALNG